MVKLLVLYGHPDDPAAFDRHYRDTHTPLTLKMPHLEAFVIGRPTDQNGPYHLVAEVAFRDETDLAAAMASDAGKAAVADLDNFATGGVTVVTMTTEGIR